MFRLFTLGLCLWTSLSFAQYERQISIYFETDKSQLTELHKQHLTTFLAGIDLQQVQDVLISGNTDSVASYAYNLALSKKRTQAVYTFLVTKAIDSTLMRTYFLGETQPKALNTNAKGRQQNRRVDIIVHLRETFVQFAEAPEPIPLPVIDTLEAPSINCGRDTIIIFPQGTEVVLNYCDYLKIQDCFNLQEFNTGESLRQSALTTMTTAGETLLSGGMFDIELCEDVCATVRLPLPNNCLLGFRMRLWDGRADGTWNRNPYQDRVKLVTINGRKYYKVRVCKSGRLNCDVKISPTKIKVKTKKRLQLIEAKLSYDCPLILLKEAPNSTSKRKNKVIFGATCPNSEPLLYAKALNQKGDTLVMDFRPANGLNKRIAFGKCKQPTIIKKVLFFKIREKSLYRKYLLHPEDFMML